MWDILKKRRSKK